MIIDFGLCVYGKNGEIYNVKKSSGFIGNLNYASYMSILKNKHSYRDDIESVIYIMIELYIGSLPWKIKDLNKKKMEALVLKKNPKVVFDFCKKNQLPYYMLNVVKYVLFSYRNNLNYDHIINLLRKELFLLKYQEDYQYDWL